MGKAKIPLFQMELIEPSGEVVAFEQEHIENAPESRRGKGRKLMEKEKKS